MILDKIPAEEAFAFRMQYSEFLYELNFVDQLDSLKPDYTTRIVGYYPVNVTLSGTLIYNETSYAAVRTFHEGKNVDIWAHLFREKSSIGGCRLPIEEYANLMKGEWRLEYNERNLFWIQNAK